MKLQTALEVIKVNIIAQIAGKSIQPVVFAGKPGLGKTRSIESLTTTLNYGLVHYSVPELNSELLSGLPSFVNAPDMTKYSKTNSSLAQATDWTVPMMIMEANRLAEQHNGCVLFLDDLHRINMSVAPYLYGLLEERALGSYKLDPRVALVCAMNDSEEAGFSGMDSPIKDRCSILPVEFDFDSWFNSHGKYLNYLISSFIKLNPHYIQEGESTQIEQFLTPRSCTYFGYELDEYQPEFIVENALELAKMKMSNSAATAFTKHVEYLSKIDFSGIVKERKKLDISSMKPIDAILYAYIVNYIDTEKDAQYLIDLIEANITEASFLGFLSGELYTKYQIQTKGKKVTKGISEILDALLNPTTSKLTIPSREPFFNYIVEFM